MNIAKGIFDSLFSYKGIQLRSNIIGSSTRGLLGVNPNQIAVSGMNNRGATTQINGSRLMTDYYRLMDELQDYELTELTTLIVTALKDFIIGYFSNEEGLLTYADGSTDKDLDLVNSYLSELRIKQDIKSNIEEIIYWGNKNSLLSWNSEKRVFEKKPLLQDHAVITMYKNQVPNKILVLDANYNITELSPYQVLRYGSLNLGLINNIKEEDPEKISDSKEITRTYEYKASMPLYYEIAAKIKEYLLNDLLISLLSIKDLVQPLLLLVQCDKNTDATMASTLSTNIENLINKYVDISTIFSARFSINDLMDSIINNIRVLPDYNGVAQGLNTLDLSKLKEKVDSLRGEQDNKKEAIVNALGLTLDYLQGRMTKFDAIRQSERLNNRVNSIVQSLNDSIVEIGCNIFYLVTKKKLKPEQLRSRLFTKTATQLTNELANSDIIGQVLNSISQTFNSVQETLSNNKLIDQVGYFSYAKSKLSLIDPEACDLLSKERYLKYIESLNKEQDDGDTRGTY